MEDGALVEMKGLGVREADAVGGATVGEGVPVGPAVLEGVEPAVGEAEGKPEIVADPVPVAVTVGQTRHGNVDGGMVGGNTVEAGVLVGVSVNEPEAGALDLTNGAGEIVIDGVFEG